jgi:signal transduction histidine kinase
VYYFIIKSVLLQQIDKDLEVEEQEILDFIKANNALPNASDYKHQLIKFEVLQDGTRFKETTNTTQYDEKEKENIPYRRLSYPVTVNGVTYKASVYKSQVETEDLLRLIMITTAAIFVVLCTLMFVINHFVLSRLWQPFFTTLTTLKDFNLSAKQQLQLPPNSIDEFEELNSSVRLMTNKVSNEYKALKAFTENASHEMQTPLAIIRSKLDLLIQSSKEDQVDQLEAIYNATGRLANLNKSLLLLTKIENQQFNNPTVIDLKKLLEEKIQQFDELIKAKNLKFKHVLANSSVKMDQELAEILLNNLFSNAIKHNYEGGEIECFLQNKSFNLSNTGPALTFDKLKIFERFQKNNESSGIGLGLAVVKQICDASGFSITYKKDDKKHFFSILF